MKFYIKYGLGGGFGGLEFLDWEEIEAENFDKAEEMAYEYARCVYESYEGLHGLRTVEDIMEEEEIEESEALALYEEEIESWIVYKVKERID